MVGHSPFGTIVSCAAEGVWFDVLCQGCRHQADVSAASLVARGWGERGMTELRVRLVCAKCGARGRATTTIRGNWVGPGWAKPEDWAETVEERMGGRTVVPDPP